MKLTDKLSFWLQTSEFAKSAPYIVGRQTISDVEEMLAEAVGVEQELEALQGALKEYRQEAF